MITRRSVMNESAIVPQDECAQAVIRDGVLSIRVPLTHLPVIIEGAWACCALNTRYKITNVAEFAADLTRELNREEEDGSTPIHRMFDKCIEEAINQGAFGIEEHENPEG